MSDMIEELKESKYWDLIYGNKDVVMSFLSGSRISGILDDRSDYDIVVFTNGYEDVNSKLFLKWNGVKVHWYYLDINTWIKQHWHTLKDFGLVLFNNIDNAEFLYKNEIYENLINLLIENKDAIATIGSYYSHQQSKELIEKLIESDDIPEELYSKVIYMLCYTSCYINNLEIDAELLSAIKRIKWQDTTLEQRQSAIELVKKLNEWFVNLKPSNIITQALMLNKQISKLILEV